MWVTRSLEFLLTAEAATFVRFLIPGAEAKAALLRSQFLEGPQAGQLDTCVLSPVPAAHRQHQAALWPQPLLSHHVESTGGPVAAAQTEWPVPSLRFSQSVTACACLCACARECTGQWLLGTRPGVDSSVTDPGAAFSR
jgi:hypothetical protein